MGEYVPKRGDIVWVSFDPQVGHEQAGRRPALVLSMESYNRLIGLFVCCPITTRRKRYPFEVSLPSNLPISGVILADQIKSFDWRERRVEFACSATEDVCRETMDKLRPVLDW